MTLTIVPTAVPLPQTAEPLREEIRNFLAAEGTAGNFVPRVDNWLQGWDPDFTRKLAARGWVGMTIPTEYGGGGQSPLHRYVVIEELLARGAPIAAHWIADRQIAPSLLRYGSDYQKQRYLPGIARGEIYFAIGMSEPDAGSDLASVRTRATQVDGGWRISGTKVWTSGAHNAHAFFVLARTEPLDTANRHAGLSQFIVELRQPQIEVRPIRLLSGEEHFNEVIIDDLFVPDALVLGEIGSGWKQVTSELSYERSGPERILSTFPLLAAAIGELRRTDAATSERARWGSLVGRLWTLRQLSISIAGALSRGEQADTSAAVVKELGTRLEGDIVEAVAESFSTEPDPDGEGIPRMLAEAILQMPGFTLRGGTNEILQGVIARAIGLR
ncbi:MULTISPECIES: acyl-CoA dehydrogenase family protein [unclassified Rhodococcus (in: high G+C Gram-positive bacteria)]|uniref:acyl-CoA dehydrogenase family protein n=1 Tax=unclassified Rhodococcus (in: high G+C Gram-positive bacteria) TaxID=192944 RepID=UPI00035C55A4|nr:acyl-CoA dehydrogenase family protein [Rhodococcus sp. DK17]